MIGTPPVLRLTSAQVTQFAGYCIAYRSYLWQYVMPTPERNQALRCIQMIQGKLEQVQEQASTEITIPLTSEEKNAVKQLLNGLLQLYGTMHPSEQRSQTLTEITGLRMTLERMWRQTQAL